MKESFSPLESEQQVAARTYNRILHLAKKSGFTFAMHPNGSPGASSLYVDRTIYKPVDRNDLVVTIDFSNPVGLMPLTGTVRYIEYPSINSLRAHATIITFMTDGEQNGLGSTYFLPRNRIKVDASHLHYPIMLRVGEEDRDVLNQFDRNHTSTSKISEHISTTMMLPYIDLLCSTYNHHMDNLHSMVNRRTMPELEQSYANVLRLFNELGTIDPDRDMVPVPVI